MTETNVTDENIRKYEIMAIVSGQLTEAEYKKELDVIKKIISDEGGQVYAEDLWGKQDLAYAIKREETAYYVVYNLALEPEKLKEVEKNLILEKHVLRHIFVKIDDDYQIVRYDEEEEEQTNKRAEKKVPKKIEPKKEEVKKEEKKEVVKEKIEEKAVEATEEKVEEKVESVEAPVKEASLEDVDKKLDDIIDNPNIKL